MIDRYKCVVSNVQATAHAAAHPDGHYVRWADYAALQAEAEALRDLLREAAVVMDPNHAEPSEEHALDVFNRMVAALDAARGQHE